MNLSLELYMCMHIKSMVHNFISCTMLSSTKERAQFILPFAIFNSSTTQICNINTRYVILFLCKLYMYFNTLPNTNHTHHFTLRDRLALVSWGDVSHICIQCVPISASDSRIRSFITLQFKNYHALYIPKSTNLIYI